MLQSDDAKGWACSVTNGIAFQATGGAKKLSQIFCKKFGAFDLGAALKQFGIR
jgi:hypothetical protein